MNRFLITAQSILHRIEDGVLVVLLLTMILMAVVQIVLRNLFDAGLLWGDVLVRVLVLWIGMVGAMAAGRKGDHINIDVVTRFLPARVREAAGGVVALATSFICGAAAWYSLRFVRMEMAYGGIAFAGVPAWVCEAILPFAFAVMAVRYLLLSLLRFRAVPGAAASPSPAPPP